MSKLSLLLLFFCLHWHVNSGQTVYSTQDSLLLFWQSQNQIAYNDYKLPVTSGGIHAEIALWTVLDLPLNIQKLHPSQMRVYLAPVCHRLYSRADTNDVSKIAVDNILFDILEVSAREARIKIANLPDSVMDAIALSETFKAIVLTMHENRLRMIRAFKKEYRLNKEKAVHDWQHKLKQDIGTTVEWATKPVECYRFILNQPLAENYSEDLNSNAKLLHTYEQVLGRATWHAEFCQISRYSKL